MGARLLRAAPRRAGPPLRPVGPRLRHRRGTHRPATPALAVAAVRPLARRGAGRPGPGGRGAGSGRPPGHGVRRRHGRGGDRPGADRRGRPGPAGLRRPPSAARLGRGPAGARVGALPALGRGSGPGSGECRRVAGSGGLGRDLPERGGGRPRGGDREARGPPHVPRAGPAAAPRLDPSRGAPRGDPAPLPGAADPGVGVGAHRRPGPGHRPPGGLLGLLRPLGRAAPPAGAAPGVRARDDPRFPGVSGPGRGHELAAGGRPGAPRSDVPPRRPAERLDPGLGRAHLVDRAVAGLPGAVVPPPARHPGLLGEHAPPGSAGRAGRMPWAARSSRTTWSSW